MPAPSQPSICVIVDGDQLPSLDNQSVRDFSVARRGATGTAVVPDAALVLRLPDASELHPQTLEECIWALQSAPVVAWTDTEHIPDGGALGDSHGPLAFRRNALNGFAATAVTRLPWPCRSQMARGQYGHDDKFFGLPPSTPRGWQRLRQNLTDAELLYWDSWTQHPVRSASRLIPLAVKSRVNRLFGRRVFDLSFYRRFERRLPDNLVLDVPTVIYETPPKGNRKRIAFCCPHLGHGGAENVFLDFARQCDRQRYELILIVTESEDSRQLAAWTQTVDWVFDLGQLAPSHTVAGVICAMAGNWRWDGLVLQNSLEAYWALPTLKAILPKLAIVDILHNIDEQWDLHESTAQAATAIDRRIVISEAGREKLFQMGSTKDSVRLIRTGVDLARFRRSRYSVGAWHQRLSIAIDTKIILFVGHLIERKRPRLLVEIDRVLQSTGNVAQYHFVIAGDGPERPVLDQLISAANAESRFDLVGQVQDIAPLMAEADILIVTSAREGTPLVISESLAMNVPAVSARVGAVDEILPPDCGVLIDGGAEQYATALVDLLADTERLHSMGVAGRAFVERQHDSALVGNQYKSLIDELVLGGEPNYANPPTAPLA